MLSDAFFVSTAVHKRKVTLPDGSEHVLHFREVPAVDFRRFHMAERSQDKEEQAASIAVLIASSLCEEDGKPALTVEKAMTLNAAAAGVLFAEVLAVNKFGGKEADAGNA